MFSEIYKTKKKFRSKGYTFLLNLLHYFTAAEDICFIFIYIEKIFLLQHYFYFFYSQVWFQNKRSKERRLKQLTSMGRGPFFGGTRKMRGFPMNLSPGGLDDGPPGFPYFAGDGKFEFGYGGPPFHPHDSPFFPGHPGGPMPFNAPGKYLKKKFNNYIFLFNPRFISAFRRSNGSFWSNSNGW